MHSYPIPSRVLVLALLVGLAGSSGCRDELHWLDADTGYLDEGGEDDGGASCSLSCSCSGGSLYVSNSCGTGSQNCSYGYDSYGRVDSLSCSYSNGHSFSCDLDYNSLGQASGGCSGGGDSCSFYC